ncbi:helix-turn-helix transcriptional regulator [Thermopolyspora sp. NPDC052614]|uniref:helix-turn-helix domain-containing protein n=1 Tax=Thermopolyspora sp. NPDC052614 TaxID=3155682 RepID=UPI003425E52F
MANKLKVINPEESPRARFAYEMRRHRLNMGWSQAALAAQLGWASQSAIGNIETMHRAPGEALAHALDRLFDLDGHFLELWRDTRPHTPDFYKDIAQAEQKANEIHTWNPLLIDGLFQTESYARAIFEDEPGITPEEVDQFVIGRMRRQTILTGSQGPMIVSLINEGALHQPAGDDALMRDQFDRLIEIAHHPRVTLQVVPYESKSLVGLLSAFEIVIKRGTPQIAHIDAMLAGRTIGERDAIGRLLLYWGSLRSAALPRRQSLAKIEEVRKRWT